MKNVSLAIFITLNFIACSQINTPIVPPVTPASMDAECAGQEVGASFASLDGCNTCSCNADGNAICTEQLCSVPE